VAQIQATMSLIEGHAEHVMDAVGKQVLGRKLAPLRKALDERRTTRSPTWRLLERLLGLELKLRQYEEGRRFCDAVVTEGGMAALNRAWSAPELLPSPEELQDPGAWMDRTRVPVVTSSTE
jgi:putative hydrolase